MIPVAAAFALAVLPFAVLTASLVWMAKL